MLNLETQITEDETILFRLSKKKWFTPFMLIFFPLFLMFSFVFIVPCFKNIFLGEISFSSEITYFASILCLIIFVPLSVLIPISYLGNDFMITNKRIFIRKGLQGILYKIDFEDIVAFTHLSQTSRGTTSHYICIYLKSNKMIKSGNLFINNDNLKDLLFVLNSKIKRIIISGKQYKKIKKCDYANYDIEIKRNILFPIISFAPFLIALMMLVLYVGGVNENGKQNDIKVFGFIEQKLIHYDKNNQISGYSMVIIDEETNKKYDIDINDEIFSMFEDGDKVLIKAKKGVLGIVYDQWFSTQ